MISRKSRIYKYLENCSCIFILAILVTFGLLSYAYGAGVTSTSTKSILPDAEVQAEIDRLVLKLSDAKNFSSTSVEEAEKGMQKDIDEFMSFKGKEKEDIFLQVLLSYGGKTEAFKNPMSEKIKRMLLIPRFVERISPQDLLDLISSHYNKTTDSVLGYAFQMSLGIIAYKTSSIDPDFSEFIVYIEKHKTEPPYLLIKYMYQLQPEKALVVIDNIYSGEVSSKQLEAKLKEKNPEIINTFSESNKWWENLYVAEKMRRDKKLRDPVLSNELRNPVLIKRLSENKNPIVQETMTEVTKEKSAK